jgi:hypothetical protein
VHSLNRDDVVVADDGVKILMWCDACDGYVKFYSRKGRVRCANALKSYYRKDKKGGSRMDVDDELVDVSVVYRTMDYVRLWDEQQAGHCLLCDSYVRMSRNGKRDNLHLVAVGPDAFVAGLFCWDCRTFLVNKLSGGLDAKADRLLVSDPVYPGDG